MLCMIFYRPRRAPKLHILCKFCGKTYCFFKAWDATTRWRRSRERKRRPLIDHAAARQGRDHQETQDHNSHKF